MKKRIIGKGLGPALALGLSAFLLFTPLEVYAGQGDLAMANKVTIEEEETPLVATPEESKRENSWWWMVVLGAGLGITIEEYVRIKAIRGGDDEEIM